MLGRSLPTKHVRFIALIVMITFLTTQFIDFTFKALAQQEFREFDEARRLLRQLLRLRRDHLGPLPVLDHVMRLLEHFGVAVALLILLVALLLGSSALAVVGLLGTGVTVVLFIVASIAKARAWKQLHRLRLDDAPDVHADRGGGSLACQSLHRRHPLTLRYRRRRGLMLLLLTNIIIGLKDQHVSHIGRGTLIFAALWVVLLVGVRKEYVRTLMSTLARRSLDFALG